MVNKINIQFFVTLLISIVFLSGCKNLTENTVVSSLPMKQDAKGITNLERNGLKTSNGIQISFSLVDSKIRLNEPVIINFSIQNGLQQTIRLDLGQDRKEGFLFNVIFPDGRKIQLPQLTRDGISAIGKVAIKPQQNYTQRLLLNEWIEFPSPGKYLLEGRLANPIKIEDGTTESVDSGFNISLDVEPKNIARLKDVSNTLAQRIIDSKSYEESVEAALALNYVKDPVAVPYLEKVLNSNKMVEQIIIKGLERIGDKSSTQVLINVLNEKPQSEMSIFARRALKGIENKSSDSDVKQMIKKSLQVLENNQPQSHQKLMEY